MPAAAVASFTPAIAGMSGTSVGASGDTAEDIGGIRSVMMKQNRHGRAFRAAMTRLDTIGLKQGTANSYFFAGAILLSAGLAASGLASGLVFDLAVSSGFSMRSTFAG